MDNYTLNEAVDAVTALSVCDPMIFLLMADGHVKRPHLHIVCATFTVNPDGDHQVVLEKSFGDPTEFEYPYAAVAEGKTTISARTGMSTREVQHMHPELLLPGDVRYYGNAVRGNRIVSASGVQPWMDEAISSAVLSIWCGISQTNVEHLRENADGDTYQGQPA